MKNKDNEAYGIKDINQYDELYISKEEIYEPKEEIFKDEEILKYSFSMNDEAILKKIDRSSRVKQTLIISTGTLAIIMAIFFLGMKRFNQNIIINDVNIVTDINKITCSFSFNNEYGIECYYGLINSNKEIIKNDKLDLEDDYVLVIYDSLDKGNYKFVVYEEFYGYNLYYYESDFIIID